MNVTFHEFLAALLRERGWNAADLARACGLSHVAIGNYLKGRRPKYDAAQKIAAVFGITPDYLLNPDVFASPLKIAAEIAKGVPMKERQRVFEKAEAVLAASLLPSDKIQEGTVNYGAGIVDWRARCLAAENQLATVKEKLAKITETINLPIHP